MFRVLLLLLALAASGRQIVPGVYTWPAGPCSLDWHQHRRAVVLACPGRDMLRLWPLPPASPWFEKPLDRPASPVIHLLTG